MENQGKPLAMKFDRIQVAVVTLLFFVSFINYMDRQILSVLVPVMRKEISLSTVEYAWAINGFLLAYAVMYAGSGVLIDRLGTRSGLSLFVVLWSVVSGLHFFIQGFAGLLLLRVLLGITEPGGWTGSIKAIAERFNAAQRGMATGIFSIGASIATFITPPLVIFITFKYSWRWAFLVLSLPGLLWVPLWLLATKNTRSPALTDNKQSRLSKREIYGLLLKKPVISYMLARFFGDSSGYFFLFWLPQYLISTKNFTITMLGTVGWIPFLGSDVGNLVGGYLSSRLVQRGYSPLHSRKMIMTLAAALVATGVLSQFASSVWAILLSCTVASLGVGVWATNLHAIPADAFEQHFVATVYGMAGSAGAVGGVIFNSLVGYFVGNDNYFAVFIALILLEPLGVAALWLWLREVKIPQVRAVIP